jgi:hypothetical protein
LRRWQTRICRKPTTLATPVRKVPFNVRQAVTIVIDYEPLSSHKAGIAVDVARVVHPRDHLVEKDLDLFIRTLRAELGDPDWSTVGNFARPVDMFLEVLDVSGSIEPECSYLSDRVCLGMFFGKDLRVNADEIDVATVACLEELN